MSTTDQLFYSPSRRGFFSRRHHGRHVPRDRVPITEARHAELLEAQAAGSEIIPGADGAPEARLPAMTVERAIAGARSEARRRILRVASLERQSNDNAAIALAALQEATLGDMTVDFVSAVRRRERIENLRDVCATVEARIQRLAPAELLSFNPADDAHWS